MSRAGLSGAMISALSASTVRPVFMVSMQTSGPSIYLCTLQRDLTWGGNTYVGGGVLLGIPEIEDTNEIKATACDIELNGASSASLAVTFELSHKHSATVFLGLLDSADSLIVDPFPLFTGKFDHASIEDDPESPRTTLRYESELIKLKRSGSFRYTDAIQQSLFPGDKGFQYAATLEDWNGYWGRAIRIKSLRKKREK